MAIVRRPPVLAVGHKGMQVLFDRVEIKPLDLGLIVKIRTHRICFHVMLVQNVQVQRLGPPVGGRLRLRGIAPMHHRTFASAFVMYVHVKSFS